MVSNFGSTLTFSDLFKSSFLKNAVMSFSLLDVILTMLVSFVISLFIYVVYKKTFNGVLYSRNFNVSLMGMSLITTLIIMGVTSNIVLSLGMVGALSIVRFRTAIKDPIDIVYLFWSISVGIVTGAGLYLLAIFGSLLIGLLLFFFSRRTVGEIPYMIVATLSDAAAEKTLLNGIASHVKRQSLRSKAVHGGERIELTVDVRLKNEDTAFINQLAEIKGVENLVLVSYNGDLSI